MSSMPKIMSSVTFTRQQMMQAMVRPITHSRRQFFITNIKSDALTTTPSRLSKLKLLIFDSHTVPHLLQVRQGPKDRTLWNC